MTESASSQDPGGRGFDALGKKVFVGLFLGLLVYAALALWGDLAGMRMALASFNPIWILVAVGLSFLNYVVRFFRWRHYCRLLGIELGNWTSFLIHLSGLSLTVTPGKMGEAFKSWLVRRVDGTPIEKSAPIVVAERFTDLLAFLLLVAGAGLSTEPDHAWIFWGTLLFCGLLLVLLGSRRVEAWTCAVCARLPVVGRMAPKLEHVFETTRVLLSPRQILVPTLTATLGWAAECTAFWFIANAFVEGMPIPFLFAVYAFALSAVAGAIVLILPGGLGVTEGTLSGLLAVRYATAAGIAAEVARPMAVSATLLIRLCTLWFAVVLGLFALFLFSRLMRARGVDGATQ
ncbi:MAG: hypothetical protein ACI8QZ_001500 [Chlamydiales bacterium]